MHIVKGGLCFIITVTIVTLSMFTTEKAPTSNIQSEYNLQYRYVKELQAQREECYEHILLLGTVSDRELTIVKRELESYLKELYAIQNQVAQMETPDALFQEIIILDEQFIRNTLQAIDLEDERYLENLEELYFQLQNHHNRLKMEY